MKKRIVVLFLCMLFLAGNAFALVSRSKWSEDPNYYSELEEDLYELDGTTLYDESEDLYDSYSGGGDFEDSSDDTYSGGGNFEGDSNDTYSGGGDFEENYDVPDQDSGTLGEGEYEETPVDEPDDVNGTTGGGDIPETPAEEPDDSKGTSGGGDIPETPAEEPDDSKGTSGGGDIPETPAEEPDDSKGTSGGGDIPVTPENSPYGPEYYDDQIDYDSLRKQYQEVQEDDDPEIIIYPEEVIRYIYIDDPIVFVDETVELVEVQVPQELAVQIETDSRNYPYRARVATRGGRLNVRSGPGTDYHVVGLIPNGSLVIVYGRSLDLNWAYVVCENGLQGFVLDAYLTTRNIFAKPVSAPAPAAPALSVVGHVDFEASTLDGINVLSNDLFGSNFVTLVNVWGTESPASIKEMAALQNIANQLASTNIAVVGICENAVDPAHVAKAAQILKDNGVTFTNLIPPANMAQIFPVRGYPTTYFVDYSGDVWGAPIEGAYPDAFVDRLIDIFNIVR